MKTTLSEELALRGFVYQTTLNDPKQLDAGNFAFYWGVDPSSDSMTIGNLAAAMMARHFVDYGNKAVLLVGGATGMIGDPDGKKQERDLKTLEEIARNKSAIAEQYKLIFAGQEFEIVDNYDWFKDISYMDFLRDIGKHVPMRQMLGREFVQSRLGEAGAGISYAEFSYSLIQGYDFLHLFREKGVTMQLCGADQWGNSIAGVDLIRRIAGAEANVWSAPLVVNKSTGVKFGKSEEGAIWLDAAKTSVFRFFQFWLNVDDDNVVDYLKIYTLLDREEINRIASEFDKDKSGRLAQKKLAYEVTSLIHGEEAAKAQVKIADTLFGGAVGEISDDDLAKLEVDFPVATVAGDMSPEGIAEALIATGLASSKTEARRFLQSGAIYINNRQLKPADESRYTVTGKYAVIRRGKNATALLKRG